MDDFHDSGVETTSGTLLSSSPSLKLILVSSKIPASSALMEATWPDVILDFFRYDKATLSDLLDRIKRRLGGEKARHVAIVSHSEAGRLYLVGEDEPISIDTIDVDDETTRFFSGLGSIMEKSRKASLDFLASNVAENDDGKRLIRRIENQIKVKVRAVSDLFDSISDTDDDDDDSHQRRCCPGNLYLNRKKLRGWSHSHRRSMTRFEKIRVVGKGAFGMAVLYRKKDEDSLVILKEINVMDLKFNERQLAVNEVQVLSMLDHANIIAYYDHFEEDGKLMIEMEYADGGTLAEYLSHSTKEMEEKEILMMFQQMADALCYIHLNNILHRDLKTANVFLMKDGMIKLGDFGIAKIMSASQQRANTVLGTPYYISPEMCEGKPYNNKSDIWALGCVVYEMANRQRTFEGSNLPALVNKIMKGQFAPVKTSYSEGFRRLVHDMLQRNPEVRPSAQGLVNNRLPPLVKKFVSDGEEEDATFPKTSSKYALYYLDLATFCLMPWTLPSRCYVTEVAVSASHLLAVTCEREVFSWGSNSCGQLGHNDTTTCAVPRLVEHLNGKSIIRVSCSDEYSMFVSDNGLLMSCGLGQYGCLGHGSMRNCHKPRLVETLLQEDVTHVACGPHHVAAVVADGSLYTWGENSHGELGLGSQSIQLVPVKVPLPSDCLVRHAVCGIDGTMLLTDTGAVYASGSNAYNKLGLNNRVGFLMTVKKLFNPTHAVVEGVWQFTCVRQLSKHRVVDVAMGAKHTALVTEVGSLLTLGSNQAGQLGTGDRKERDLIATVKSMFDQNIMLVSCGETFTVCATEDNKVFVWGSRPRLMKTVSEEEKNPPEFSSLDKGTSDSFPGRNRSSSEPIHVQMATCTSISARNRITSNDSLSSILSSLSTTGSSSRLKPMQTIKKRHGGRPRILSDAPAPPLEFPYQDVIAAMTGPLTTASLSLGIHLADIAAPILSPTEISLMDRTDSSLLLGLPDRILSAKVVGLLSCLGYVFVHVEASVPVLSDEASERRKNRGRKRSLSSLKRKLNLLRRVTIRKTVQSQSSVIEEETEEKATAIADENEDESRMRTWLRRELEEAVEIQSFNSQSEDGPSSEERSLSTSRNTQFPSPIQKTASPRPARRSGAVKGKRRSTSAGSRASTSSPSLSLCVSQDGGKDFKAASFHGLASEGTKESLMARIEQLEDEKRRVDEQLEMLRRERNQKDEEFQEFCNRQAGVYEERLRDEVQKLKSDMDEQNVMLQQSVGAVKSLQEKLDKMMEVRVEGSSGSQESSRFCSIM